MYFLIFLIPVLLLVDYLYRRKINKKAANIPGRSNFIPFFGDRRVFKVGSVEELLQTAAQEVSRYGKTFSLWVFHEFIVVTTDPKVLNAVLNNPKHIKKPRFYDALRPWLGDCVLLSFGRRWKLTRKILGSVFHFSAYEDSTRVFDEQSSIFVKCLNEQCGKGAFDMSPYVSAASLDIIAEIGMGFKMNAQTTKSSEYAKALHVMASVISKRISQPILSFDSIFQIFTPHLKKKQDECIKVLHSYGEKSIREGRKILQQKDPAYRNPFIANKVERKHRYNVIDYLLQAVVDGEPLSDTFIREEVDALIFGGHDTLTTVILFTLYLLSRHPEAQNKVFEEIREAIGDDLSTPVGLNELSQLKYLECVLKEAMRLYPPGPAIARKIEEDINVGELTIPAGTTVVIPIKLIHLNSEVFPEPEKFIPDRFAVEAELEKKHPYSFMTFSAGVRDCGGRKFALLELKSIMSKVIRHFELLPLGEDPIVKWDVLISSTNGIHLGLKPRAYS